MSLHVCFYPQGSLQSPNSAISVNMEDLFAILWLGLVLKPITDKVSTKKALQMVKALLEYCLRWRTKNPLLDAP